jgi:hypothetical protein
MSQAQRNTLEIMRDEMIVRDNIRELLSSGPQTIPALADALGAPTTEVLMWVMAMRRYGMLEEVGRADASGYFKYGLAKEEEK